VNPAFRPAAGLADGADASLVEQLLRALCDESEALKKDDPAALAAAERHKRALLRLLLPAGDAG
jgi:hypothetical protein